MGKGVTYQVGVNTEEGHFLQEAGLVAPLKLLIKSVIDFILRKNVGAIFFNLLP